MAETSVNTKTGIAVRYRGRLEQIGIYFGKFIRMFIYQSDWKVLPMSACVAGLVGMVMSTSLFQTLEGSIMGSFALVMVCIWNGCFNSIQVICRERDVIKREHRSGMHVSSYIISHTLYQAMLCLMQTVITIYVTKLVGMRYDLCQPMFSRWFLLDFGFSIFLITFASDMMSLFISTLCRSTTTAMTIMPFVLIFQLVFSGGMLALPDWSMPLTKLTISAPGLNVIAAQGDTNKRPLVSLWNSVQSLGNMELGGEVTLGQVLDFLDSDASLTKELRDREMSVSLTVGQIADYLCDENNDSIKALRGMELRADFSLYETLSALESADLSISQDSSSDIVMLKAAIARLLEDPDSAEALKQVKLSGVTTLGELMDASKELGLLEPYRDQKISVSRTVGELLDMMKDDKQLQELRDQGFPVKMTVAELQSRIGVERVRQVLQEKAAATRIKPEYDYTRDNVLTYWGTLMLFIAVFVFLSMVSLKFIDKDKR